MHFLLVAIMSLSPPQAFAGNNIFKAPKDSGAPTQDLESAIEAGSVVTFIGPVSELPFAQLKAARITHFTGIVRAVEPAKKSGPIYPVYHVDIYWDDQNRFLSEPIFDIEAVRPGTLTLAQNRFDIRTLSNYEPDPEKEAARGIDLQALRELEYQGKAFNSWSATDYQQALKKKDRQLIQFRDSVMAFLESTQIEAPKICFRTFHGFHIFSRILHQLAGEFIAYHLTQAKQAKDWSTKQRHCQDMLKGFRFLEYAIPNFDTLDEDHRNQVALEKTNWTLFFQSFPMHAAVCEKELDAEYARQWRYYARRGKRGPSNITRHGVSYVLSNLGELEHVDGSAPYCRWRKLYSKPAEEYSLDSISLMKAWGRR